MTKEIDNIVDLKIYMDRKSGYSHWLKKLPYRLFLDSTYWKVIKKHKLNKANYICETCLKENVELEVHHLTYENRGWEHINLNDLTVLCKGCHYNSHNGSEAI